MKLGNINGILSVLNIFKLLLCSMERKKKVKYIKRQMNVLYKNVGKLSIPCINFLTTFYFWPALKIT